jgi:hypothetical protein
MKLSWMANQMIARIRSAIARLQIPGRSITHVTVRKKGIGNKEINKRRVWGEGWSEGGERRNSVRD